MREQGRNWAADISEECEKVDDEAGARALTPDQVSPALREALEHSTPGETGMRSVRAVGPDGRRYAAGLYEGSIFLLELPWPNPNGECRKLRKEPEGVTWRPYRGNG